MENLTFDNFIKNYNYYGFRKCRAYINGVLYNGYFYKIDTPTAEKMQKLKEYKNTLVFSCRSEYAPEQIKTAVFIAHGKSKAKNAKNII